jgi:spore coat polysaccharide biosynthesis predicted glycosyltransferase SpsG
MVIFRADVSPRTGLSRLRRCAYLASQLRDAGEVLILCREDKGAAKFLAGQKASFRALKDPAAFDPAGARALILDLESYSQADAAQLERARSGGARAVLIAPPGDAPAGADRAVAPAREPQLALLHHKFRHFHKARRKYRRKARNIFVHLGDLLPYRDLRQVVDVLHRLGLRIKVEPGPGLKKADRRNLARIYPGVHFRGRSESAARSYFEADLALVRPGDEALEAACVGTPALYLCLEKGQDERAESWISRGLGANSPSLADFSVQSVRAAIEPLDQAARERMGAAGRALVDGLGVPRFMAQLRELIDLSR